MKKNISKNLTFYIGAFVMFFTGLFYMFMSDLTFKNPAYDLIVAVLLSFGSALLFFFSAAMSEKPARMALIKIIAIILAIGFVVYVYFFKTGFSVAKLFNPDALNYPAMLDKFEKAGISGKSDLLASKMTMIVTLVCGGIAIVAQLANVIISASNKDE